MIREQLLKKELGKTNAFRWRSHEVSRIEGLSDAVFAFAVTLLVVSLEVPQTFNELAVTMRGFGAFAISFVLLFSVWFTQYKFFPPLWTSGHADSFVECGVAFRGAVLCLSAEVPVHLFSKQIYRRPG